ncbi:sulfotransferase [Leisingera sp. JC11]|uniref:tetratricopeptide repeat-containing sulfotransferase family protein n=1 Tax=Leisingera sp. JC11 TaxID=3042469 RepID=UPI003451D0B7
MSLQSDIQTALTLTRQGNHKAALKAAKAAMKKHKGHPLFPNLAAVALCAAGKEREAIPLYRKALELDPSFHDARRNLGLALAATGQTAKAETVLAKAAALQPEDFNTWLALASARRSLQKFEEARAAAAEAVRLAPRNVQAVRLLAETDEDLGEINAALSGYRHALKLAPREIGLHYSIADLLIYQLQTAEALKVLEEARSVEPDNTKTLSRIAAQLNAAGLPDEACTVYRDVLRLDPGNANALLQLALALPADELAELQETAEAKLKKTPAKTLDHATLDFAAAHFARRTGDFQKAAELFRSGNKTVAQLLPYDRRQQTHLSQEAFDRFPEPAVLQADAAQEPCPIYVIGMPRSGTTLTEAVLGAHPAVIAAGERRIDERMVAALQSSAPFGTEEVKELARVTRENLPPMPAGTRAYVDKMPENFRFLGFLLQASPQAKVIHLRRDPRDTALSQWQTLFAGGALPYTYDLRAMAHRFNLYAELMAHWHRVLPGRILDLRYEDLVADVEAGSRLIASHCGLDWVHEMAEPHRHTGQVLTASLHQVREPVHTRSVRKWEQHLETLDAFVSELAPDLWPELREG